MLEIDESTNKKEILIYFNPYLLRTDLRHNLQWKIGLKKGKCSQTFPRGTLTSLRLSNLLFNRKLMVRQDVIVPLLWYKDSLNEALQILFRLDLLITSGHSRVSYSPPVFLFNSLVCAVNQPPKEIYRLFITLQPRSSGNLCFTNGWKGNTSDMYACMYVYYEALIEMFGSKHPHMDVSRYSHVYIYFCNQDGLGYSPASVKGCVGWKVASIGPPA